MSQDPAQIRADIDRTRTEMAQDASRLGEKVSPTKVVGRRVDAVKGAVGGAKDKVFGSDDSGTSSTSTASDLGSTVSGAVTGAPEQARQKAAGNPLVAGAVAFGVGYLLSSLLPSSSKEQQLAGQVKEQASQLAEPAKAALTTAAADIKDEVAPQAAEAAESMKSTGAEAAQAVKETASGAATDVQSTAGDAAGSVKETASSDEGGNDPYPATEPVGTGYPATPVEDVATPRTSGTR